MRETQTTLLFVLKGDSLLLAQKKHGFGKGKLMGIGGKVKKDETIEQAMIRETKEEVNIIPIKYEKIAVIDLDEYVNAERENIIINVFIATEYIGEPEETEEMKPEWVKLKNIPYGKMFPDASIWLPEVLAGKRVRAYFKCDENFNIISHKIYKL